MRVLIVAKTRRGAGACVGGITAEGKSVRLVAVDAATNEHAGLQYEVGEVWEVDWAADEHIVPPHVENIIVCCAQRLKQSADLEKAILRFMPPATGGPEKLFDGRLQASSTGALFVTERTGLPSRSTMFWRPDQPLALDYEGKRIRYRYPTADGGRTITFVGFQELVQAIPAGTLLRVSLAHRWRPSDRPEEELRCYVQLSGWFPFHSSPDVNVLPAGIGSAREPKPTGVGKAVRVGQPWPTPAVAADGTVRVSASERGHSCPPVPGSRNGGEESPRSEAPGPGGVAQSGADRLQARRVLKQTFGFSEFLPVQGDVVAHVLQGRDALAVMPTGGGKSLCYQLPALLRDGLTVVVSPLIALMQDQVGQLRQLGIPAAFLNSTVALRDYICTADHVRRGEVKLLYVAPETLLRPETLLLLAQSRLRCLAVDEAHCISEWGHDFRPEYRQLESVRRRFPQAVCLALTATATGRVRQDIRRLLGIPADGEFMASFNRPNLFLSAAPRLDALAQTLAFLEKHRGQSGIIYCGKRRQVDELSASLNANGWPTLPYHAGLEDERRCRNQQQFMRDEVPLMVATIAFGLGINKANVRFVVHHHSPKDLESYYQEIGRAGRDGLRADCLLLYSRGDAMLHRHFIDLGAESERAGREARLDALISYAEARNCRRIPLLAYFGETLASPCGHCDNCVSTLGGTATADVTAVARKFLSCVTGTGQVFGIAHITAVLRGSRSKKVLRFHHDRLSTYGTGAEHSVEGWRDLAQKFIRQGLVDTDLKFGGLRLTPKGWQVLNAAAVPPPPVTVPASAPSGPIARPPAKRRSHEIGELFRGGASIEDIAAHYVLRRETVLVHLHHFHQAGGKLDAERLLASSTLSEPERRRVLAAFDHLGLERLAPVHYALSGAIAYYELHLLRLYALCQQAATVQPGNAAADGDGTRRLSSNP